MFYTKTSKHRLYAVIAKHLFYEKKENHEKNIFGAEYYSFISSR
jgi:hypothetical protein